ncbi:MAG: SDR family NAD(P)-dependent oxidoreductase [Actinomycetota bacterium]
MWPGKVCLVTGAAGGIGRAIAQALESRGATIVAVDVDSGGLQQLIQSFGGPPHSSITCDVSDLAGVRRMAQQVISTRSGIDVLINNAGVAGRGKLDDSTSEDSEFVIGVNLLGPIWCTKELLGALNLAPRTRRTPAIVNVASITSRVPAPSSADYCASKFALAGFTESVWAELGGNGIRVMMVNPGFTDTEGFPMDRVLSNPRFRWAVMKPRRVALAVVKGVERGSSEVYVQWWLRIAYRLGVVAGPLRRIAYRKIRTMLGNIGKI